MGTSGLLTRIVAAGFLLSVLVPGIALAQLTPEEAIGMIPRGINLGNTLEPETEGGWNNGPAQEYYFDDYVAAGFQSVRIPVRWDKHTSMAPPFTVAASWMDRVEQIVDWALARGLFVVINGHHEEWLKVAYGNPVLRDRYDAIWAQISERFKNKSERLFFEIINEPNGMTAADVDDLNARILGIIRQTNPTRIVIYSGNEWSSATRMMAAAIPDDDYLMAYYHSYDPWSFAGEGQGKWGTSADRATLAQAFQTVANWSASTGIPVMISEFGAVHEADYNSRMAHYAAYVDNALSNGVAFQVWDDGGWFQVYERDTHSWEETKDILVHSYPDGPTLMSHQIRGDSVVVLSWANRSGTYDAVRVQRVNWSGGFQTIAELPGDATSHEDWDVGPDNTYNYRVVAMEGGHPDRVGYPHRVTVVPTRRWAYNGSPAVIPGVVEAEEFDIGGEGLTYHDSDEWNTPEVYRLEDAVDVEARDGGGYQVGYVEAGEWLEYTINVQTAGSYELTAHIAAMDGGGTFRFEIGGNRSSLFIAPNTDSWQATAPVMRTISLEAGVQIMRVTILGTPNSFNLDCFELRLAGSTAIEELPEPGTFSLYPNPAGSELTLSMDRVPGPSVRAEVVDMIGRVVRRVEVTGPTTRIETGNLPGGMYVVRVLESGVAEIRKTVVVF